MSKVTSITNETGLDDLFSARGYEKQATTLVQILNLNVACESTDDCIEVLQALDDERMVDYSQPQHMFRRELGRNCTILDRVGLGCSES